MSVRELTDAEKELLNQTPGPIGSTYLGSNLQEMQKAINAGGGGGISGAGNVGTGAGQVFKQVNAGLIELRRILAGTNMTVTQIGDDISLDASASGSSDYVFWPSAPVEVGNVFKSWPNLMAAIAALPSGIIPTVTFRESFTVPSAGMPISGWDMRLGILQSFIMATGSIVVTVPDGVKFDNVAQISYGLEVDCAPTTADGVFGNSILGGLNILVVGLGAKLVNTGTKALMDSAGQIVLVLNGATQDIPPVSTGPFVKINGTDGTIAIMLGDSPNTVWTDGWIVGGNPGAQLIYIHGIQFNLPNIPGWAGDAPIEIAGGKAANLFYDDTAQAPASGSNRVQGVIDWLKTQIGGGGSAAPVYEIVFDPAAVTETDNLKNTFDTLMQRVGLLSPEPVTVIVRKAGVSQVISIPRTGMPGPGWDFEKIKWVAAADSVNVTLDFADGTYVQNMHGASDGVQFRFNETTAPVCSITGIKIIGQDGSGFVNVGTQPIFQVNGGFLFFYCRGAAAPFQKLGGVEAVDIQSGSMQIDFESQTLNNGFLSANNQISGPGGAVTFNIYTLIPGGYNRTDASFAGTTTVNMYAETRVKELARLKIENFVSNASMLSDTGLALGDTSGGAFTVSLPAPSDLLAYARPIVVKNTGVLPLTVDVQGGGNLIDNASSKTLATQYDSLTVISDGSMWWVV